MKTKTIAWTYIILLSIGTILNLYIPKTEAVAGEAIVIPNEAIRLRILANSDTEDDQALKRKVRDAVNAEITKWVTDLASLDEARNMISTKLPEITQTAQSVLQKENSSQTVKAEFKKVQFPTKLYGQFLYPAGEYEAILITLGDGKGANWWCVLFPPLCFLDFSNGTEISDSADEDKIPEVKQEEKPKVKKEKKEKQPLYTAKDEDPVEVKFFIKELWLKLFN